MALTCIHHFVSATQPVKERLRKPAILCKLSSAIESARNDKTRSDYLDGGLIISRHSPKRAITLVDVLAAIAVVGFLILIIFAAIPRMRENTRLTNCTNNLKQIGLGLQNYHNARKHFPGSAEVVPMSPQTPVGGWSFLFKIMPYIEYDTIYNSINPDEIKNTVLAPGAPGSLTIPLTTMGTGNSSPSAAIGPGNWSNGLNAIAYARDTSIYEFLCPSNWNMIFERPGAPCNAAGLGTRHTVTNYKAMCSAFFEGFQPVNQYIGKVTVPEGEYPGLYQCDGGLYPTNSGIRLNDIADGLSHTILCGETMDDRASTWIAGSDVNMVAIPLATPQISSGATPVLTKDSSGSSFFGLPGFNGEYGKQGGTGKLITFFSLDYGPKGKNAGMYALDPFAPPCQSGTRANTWTTIADEYGPSSGHPTIINCLFGDGCVRGVRKDVDAAALFHAVTRSNHDPAADDHL